MGFLGKLINLGGLLNGSKTLLGVVTVGYTAVTIFLPDIVPTVDTVLQVLGLSLLPIGVADKIRKSNGAN